MARPKFQDLTLGEIHELVEALYDENQELRAKTANRPKLETWEVIKIREMAGRFSQREIARMFDVSPGTINRIVRRIYYANL